MKRLIKPLSIRKNLLMYFLILFCLPFLLFSLIWYAKSAQTIEETGIYYNEQLTGRVSSQLDEYFSTVKADSLALPGHPLVQQLIKADPNNYYENYILKSRISRELLPNLRKDVYRLSIISASGAYYGEPLPGGMPVYSENFKILGVSEINGTPVISVYRKIFDNVSYRPSGAIVMSLSLQKVLRIADIKPYGENGSIVIASETGQILYHTDRSLWGSRIPDDWMKSMTTGQGRYVEVREGGRINMVYQVSPVTGFKIISETSESEMLGGLVHLQLMTFLIGAFILILAFLLFYRMFREVRKLLLEIHTTRLREKELELKNKEALMSAMQSQINPHFLYNTLEIINSYAVMWDIKPISKMTVSLSNMFRYSISDPDQVIFLRKELEYIRHYIDIQKERFEDLHFELQIGEDVMDEVCLFPLILQPLVENAFQHAYEKQGLSPGRITVSGQPEEEFYIVSVRDEGGGMPEEVMNNYNNAFASVSPEEMLRSGFRPFSSIGLWNVHSRLRLAFGPPYGLTITSSSREGSEIQVKLPYLKGVL